MSWSGLVICYTIRVMSTEDESAALTNTEIRRRRLADLVRETEGGLAAIAQAADVSAQNLDHILKRRKQSKTRRPDGSLPVVSMGDKLARDIERAMNLTPGWLDWPFDGVDFNSWTKLNDFQRALVQGRMVAAIEDALQKNTPALQAAAKPPVPNKAVEKHYKPLPQGEAQSAAKRAGTASKARERSSGDKKESVKH